MIIMTNGKTNTQIWNTDKAFLTGIQKQIRFLMSMHLQQRACPNCGHPSNIVEAAGVAIDDYSFGHHTDDRGDRIGPCPQCQRTLIYTLPWPTGEWYWRLDPNEATARNPR